ncbi:hypothetical protein J1N35_013292 [Gossypium stocksii]|uniref:Uncharacterized protein n=1 Tax=Gossypium stocksii TaxID=47602 RepID=A0A9D3VTM0_9ROSI|nr:hypothetical protein J1N35_013292 [Gossypium stocksii]
MSSIVAFILLMTVFESHSTSRLRTPSEIARAITCLHAMASARNGSVQLQSIPDLITPGTITDNMHICFNTSLASRENSCVPEPFNLQIMIARNIVVKKSPVYNL